MEARSGAGRLDTLSPDDAEGTGVLWRRWWEMPVDGDQTGEVEDGCETQNHASLIDDVGLLKREANHSLLR